MRHYERTTEMKKRRGTYSETDLYAYQQAFSYTIEPDWNYVGTFERSKIKNISINQNTNIFLTTNNIYKIRYSDNSKTTVTDLEMKQILDITFIKDPVINLTLSDISKGCTIDYSITDNEPTQKFIVTEKLNNTVIATKLNSIGGNYSIVLTDEQILPLQVNSQNNITIEISTEQGGLVVSKTATFTRINNKPTVLVSSYNSNSAKFTASDLDNNLSKIEWYLDDVLKETITTDLTAEKTINYELTDNAIHTLKIVATDAENATVEKVLSISKEIMPLQTDASLSDISTKLIEIGEGFKNGKTSIINTLALKNIEASLNNTLVELSEKIKTSFDSSDTSVQDLQNQVTQKNNTITQLETELSKRKRFITGTYTFTKTDAENFNLSIYDKEGTSKTLTIPVNMGFSPSLIVLSGVTFSTTSKSYVYFDNVCNSNFYNFGYNSDSTHSNPKAVGILNVSNVGYSSLVLTLYKLSMSEAVGIWAKEGATLTYKIYI
ncbi:Uncharacterised protein [Clostridioides difficile]|uniref:hypothetical protein n=1 Tax=Clostridioides difficile TaxID=1496 RepID=UPI001024A64F|nr:hypothetical protein [Clostridioides difficile]VFE50456.1 Uncharacterised protein [Clostridioides difficile]VIH22948.1 Uncharacterised protein [Clostridioides difficile]